jgi:hypothetical protein
MGETILAHQFEQMHADRHMDAIGCDASGPKIRSKLRALRRTVLVLPGERLAIAAMRMPEEGLTSGLVP